MCVLFYFIRSFLKTICYMNDIPLKISNNNNDNNNNDDDDDDSNKFHNTPSK